MRTREEVYSEAAKYSMDGSTENIRLCLEVLLDIRDLLALHAPEVKKEV